MSNRTNPVDDVNEIGQFLSIRDGPCSAAKFVFVGNQHFVVGAIDQQKFLFEIIQCRIPF